MLLLATYNPRMAMGKQTSTSMYIAACEQLQQWSCFHWLAAMQQALLVAQQYTHLVKGHVEVAQLWQCPQQLCPAGIRARR